jgi:hypothetical protein
VESCGLIFTALDCNNQKNLVDAYFLPETDTCSA